ncbi:MAG TPA: SMC-Scp complex subunit ScpB [Gammaproteobacteria bacterium]|jgi:segregation and condensation protein B
MKPEKKVELRNIVEGALLAAGRPLSVDELLALFAEDDRPERTDLRKALDMLQAEFEGRGIELKEVASGYRIQVRKELGPWVSRLWEERPARYSRALLETLALVAYRQPITRGEIEEVRGVTVSTNIIRTLQERGWVRVVGHRDVPGHPEMFGTTKEFLDYFSLKSLDELPTLAQLRDIESINAELDFGDGAVQAQAEPAPDAPAAAPRLVEDLAPEQDEDDGEAGVTTH